MDGTGMGAPQALQGVCSLPGLAACRPRSVCERVELSVAGRAALAADPAPKGFLAALLEAGCLDDALQFLAHALPRARAVAWACVCVRISMDVQPIPAAEGWARVPGERVSQETPWLRRLRPARGPQAARVAALGAA
ncbi:DUF6931 family protein [Azohydromonas lata]|uniref:Uncharacterized protein n=1 Tax=Azohydromonas lata TaxID=45677 RepID=A0ABU5IEB9_9BURK|nr:hypothetical protein [Azohydromonas lata]MDZ5456860.1 hypothetical protein [Azohydromonas lata]